jgi:hypothetical protein
VLMGARLMDCAACAAAPVLMCTCTHEEACGCSITSAAGIAVQIQAGGPMYSSGGVTDTRARDHRQWCRPHAHWPHAHWCRPHAHWHVHHKGTCIRDVQTTQLLLMYLSSSPFICLFQCGVASMSLRVAIQAESPATDGFDCCDKLCTSLLGWRRSLLVEQCVQAQLGGTHDLYARGALPGYRDLNRCGLPEVCGHCLLQNRAKRNAQKCKHKQKVEKHPRLEGPALEPPSIWAHN